MVCDENSCDVFKFGLCIKCPANIFKSKAEFEATESELSNFVNCCVMGKTAYNDGNSTCSSDFAGGAFNATNQANATLKEAYQCNEQNQNKSNYLIQAA